MSADLQYLCLWGGSRWRHEYELSRAGDRQRTVVEWRTPMATSTITSAIVPTCRNHQLIVGRVAITSRASCYLCAVLALMHEYQIAAELLGAASVGSLRVGNAEEGPER